MRTLTAFLVAVATTIGIITLDKFLGASDTIVGVVKGRRSA